MTKEDYLSRHIQHRLRLLTIFKNNFENETDESIDEKKLSDFYVCSKDISIQMTRTLLFELGIKLQQKKQVKDIEKITNLKDYGNDKEILERIQTFNITKIEPNKIPPNIEDKLIVILKIANRAISHIVDEEVDHVLLRHSDTLEYLIPVINYVEKKVKSNILQS